MFTAFLRDHPDCNGVISYADRRWSVGNLYDQLGFRNDGYSRPSYSYFKNSNINREYRWKYQKQNIKHLVEDGESKSETEIMVELGYNRIWDCGTIRYIWERK